MVRERIQSASRIGQQQGRGEGFRVSWHEHTSLLSCTVVNRRAKVERGPSRPAWTRTKLSPEGWKFEFRALLKTKNLSHSRVSDPHVPSQPFQPCCCIARRSAGRPVPASWSPSEPSAFLANVRPLELDSSRRCAAIQLQTSPGARARGAGAFGGVVVESVIFIE